MKKSYAAKKHYTPKQRKTLARKVVKAAHELHSLGNFLRKH